MHNREFGKYRLSVYINKRFITKSVFYWLSFPFFENNIDFWNKNGGTRRQDNLLK